MGTNFTGITFDDCNVSPSDDGIINRKILPDGILSGCKISYSGSTLTMASGTLIACGRHFRHPAAQNWAVVDATTGYARLLITLDLTRSATDQTFDQVVDAVEYANDISGFPALVQQDLNAAGTKYQIVACVVSLGTGGISGIINTMPTVQPASADGGTLTVTAPAGSTVTVSKDDKTLTRAAGDDGIVVFRGLQSGTWTLSITDGSDTARKTVEIVADYATSITFFAATIHITYPAGSVCTATGGKTTLTAPDTSGTWECVVPNAGEWVFSIDGKFREPVLITENGQTETVNQWHVYNNGAELCDIVSFNPVSDVFSAYAAPIKNSDHINFLNSGAVRGSGVYANADLTGFTKLCFEITASGSNINTNGGMYVAATTNNLWGQKLASTTIDYSSSKTIFVVDVSGFSGEYSCCIGDWSTNYDIKLYRMWLE